jgi:hypothetical protein
VKRALTVKEYNGNFATKIIGFSLLGLIIYLILNGFSLYINIDNIIRSVFLDVIISSLWESTFQRWFWKVSLIRVILGIKTPYIHGRWKGYLKSSFDNFKTQFPIVIEIHQIYKFIRLTYYDEKAVSHGLLARFIIEEGTQPKLLCVYRNEPIVASQELQMHYGTMILTISREANEMRGVYFNYYLQRGTYGELYVKLESRKLQYKF